MTHSARPIYFDYHATTPVDQRVAARVLHAMTLTFGNAHSTEHQFGVEAAELVNEAQHEVAKLANAVPDDVMFTSGATESIRLAIAHAVRNCSTKPLRVAVLPIEHRAVLDTLAIYERKGEANVRWLSVNTYGQLNLEQIRATCAEKIDLLCVMAANNEVGTIYPIKTVAEIARAANVSLLVDATQAAGRIPLDVTNWGITYLILSGHKMYAPKGVGALIMRQTGVQTSLHGTLNVPGIVGLGEACRLRRLEMEIDEPRIKALRDRLEYLLLAAIDGIVVNGDPNNRLVNNLHVSIPNVPNDVVLVRLSRQVAISSGSACTSGAQTPSHVLQAMNLSTELQEGALRIGIGKFTTQEEIDEAANCIIETVNIIQTLIA